MKILLKISILLLLPFSCFGQNRINEKEVLKSKEPYKVEIDIKKKEKIDSTGFNYVVLKDSRIDTSEMGSVLYETKKGYQQLQFEGGTDHYLNKKLQQLLKEDLNKDTLYIRLNDLWFGETISQAGWFKGVMFGNTELDSKVWCNFDIFISREGKLNKKLSVDTVFSANGWLPNNCNKLAERFLKSLIVLGSASAGTTGEIIPRSVFDSISRPGILPPILKNPKLNRGIYFSFQQFLDNDPEEIAFSKLDLKKNVKLRYKQAVDTTKDIAWGFSDGENVYMHLDSMYYKLIRKNNKFITSAPLSIEIINSFASRALTRTMNFFTSYYFLYDPPFRGMAASELFRQDKRVDTYYRYYDLNLCNGTLR